jgi:UDP-glucose 4-epimerase
MSGKVLITGGTGYIGSHAAVEFQQAGYAVVIADDLSNSKEEVVDRIALITGMRPGFEKTDLKDPAQAEELFRKYPGIVAVIHFAACKSVGESVEAPLKYYHNNLFALINLLEAMKAHGVNYLVFSSSCTVYGEPDVLPVNEEAPVKKAASPYGRTKQMSEVIISDECSAGGIQAVLLRYFNPIGAHPSALIGELPLGIPDNLVPYMTQTAIGKRKELKVFGDDYGTADGTPVRDYIHVVDLARAHVAAMERLLKKKNRQPVEVFNLGTGRGYSVLEVIRAFEKVSGLRLNYSIDKRRPGDVESVWADPSLAEKELGWKAERGLEEMVLSAWEWEQQLTGRPAGKPQ